MSIIIDKNSWVLEMDSCAYALGLSPNGYLTHRYWGPRLQHADDYPLPKDPDEEDSFNLPENRRLLEYPTAEGADYRDPCLCIRFQDGVRDVRLRFVDAEAEQDKDILKIHLTDLSYELHVILCYQIHSRYDLIERWVEIYQEGMKPIDVSRIFSSIWHLPDLETYRLSYTSGKWADEMKMHHEILGPGKKVLASRRLITGHNGNPWFALDDGTATEYTGKVWFGTVAWSGNWKTIAEISENQMLQILSGINDWDFNWQLQPGERFTTPHAIGGFSSEGFHEASQKMHDYVREEYLPHGKITRKILYNSWEATTFDVDVHSQIALAKNAAEMGVELFVLDDGWFNRRNDDRAGLGDWWPDEKKFPEGLTPLIDEVKKLGMDFGLWIEPEMVNPDSDLYRLHPDWVIHFPGLDRTLARNQLILNLAKNEVQEYLISVLDKLLSENDIRFIKWDMNRNVSEPGWPDASGDARELWVRYTMGVYHVWQTLRQRHPNIIFQSCSGGGGRVDLGIMKYADQVWPSDNTEASARLCIQENYLQLFPAATMESWVTDQNEAVIPLAFRFHVSMCGVLGIGGNIANWSDTEREEAKHWISEYKKYREIIHWGDRYLLRSAVEYAVSAVLYISQDQQNGVLFAFRTYCAEPVETPTIYPRGLAANQLYEIVGQIKSGSAWEEVGIRLSLSNFSSVLIPINRI
ncbi:MAG: alpha-galactosidase [Anaerolineaceae bacterium]|nr:alpha-galactosidase [Anaerolineaceae bacterium]